MSNHSTFDLISPVSMHRPNGYSHLARLKGGTPVFIAGQVALDPSGHLVGPGDFRTQAQQVFENLRSAVEAAGGSFSNIVKLNVSSSTALICRNTAKSATNSSTSATHLRAPRCKWPPCFGQSS
jgi:Endoribonuclease L-PSP